MSVKRLVLLTLVCLMMVATVSAGTLKITANPSETGIVFSWNDPSSLPPGTSVDVYIDGKNVANSTLNRYWYLSGLHPQEMHEIDIRNPVSGVSMATLAVSTLHPELVILFLIVILFLLLFATILLRGSPVMVIVIGAISVAIALYTGQISVGYGGITIIPYILAIISGGLVLLALWEIIIEKTQWG